MMLENQSQFEELWFNNGEHALKGVRSSDNGWIVYFTAAWCGPCKKLNYDDLCLVAQERGLTLWKCDDTINSYTAGYCGVRSFPTFAMFTPKTVVSIYKSNVTEDVADWIRTL